MTEQYLSPKQACEYLGVSRKSLERYVEHGYFKKYKRRAREILFKKSELDHFLEIRPKE